jgi:hypothetical protein
VDCEEISFGEETSKKSNSCIPLSTLRGIVEDREIGFLGGSKIYIEEIKIFSSYLLSFGEGDSSISASIRV